MLAARSNDLALDQPDIQFATPKERCRGFAATTRRDYIRLKRLVRYLLGRPRLHPPGSGKGRTPRADVVCPADCHAQSAVLCSHECRRGLGRNAVRLKCGDMWASSKQISSVIC